MCSKKIISFFLSAAVLTAFSFSLTASAIKKGDANSDGKVDVRDAAYIAGSIVLGRALNDAADYNEDGMKNIRDAAAIVNDINNKTVSASVSYDERSEEMLELVNRERSMTGAMSLSLNSALTKIANERAREIAALFSHTRPNGSSCFSLFDEYGVEYTWCGENIVAGTSNVKSTFKQWKNSPGHYQNMIDGNFTQMGIGYFYDENSYYKHYWVQVFRRP